MNFLVVYIIGFFVAALLTMLLFLYEPFFHYVMDDIFLANEQIKNYTAMIATMKNKSEYDVLFPFILLTFALLSCLSIVILLALLIDVFVDKYHEK